MKHQSAAGRLARKYVLESGFGISNKSNAERALLRKYRRAIDDGKFNLRDVANDVKGHRLTIDDARELALDSKQPALVRDFKSHPCEPLCSEKPVKINATGTGTSIQSLRDVTIHDTFTPCSTPACVDLDHRCVDVYCRESPRQKVGLLAHQEIVHAWNAALARRNP